MSAESSDMPLPLMAVELLYFTGGFSALISLIDGQIDILRLFGLVVAIGLFVRSELALVALNVLAVIHTTFWLLMVFGGLFAESSYAKMSLFGYELPVSKWVVLAFWFGFCVLQLYAARSERTKSFLSTEVKT